MSTTAQRNGSTRKWRATRARTLRTLPAQCGICGEWITDPAGADVDHILPVALGGTDAPSNLRLTHSSCNRGRHVTVRRKAPAAPPIDPSDPDPGNLVTAWSRHWYGGYKPRCPACRKHGQPCPDAA